MMNEIGMAIYEGVSIIQFIELLGDKSLDINCICDCGCNYTVLDAAVRAQRYDLARILLDNAKALNLNINQVTRQKCTAFEMAIYYGDNIMIKLFLDRRNTLDIKTLTADRLKELLNKAEKPIKNEYKQILMSMVM